MLHYFLSFFKGKLRLCFLAFFIFQTSCIAKAKKQSLDRIFLKKNRSYLQGVYIARVRDNKVLYKSNENKLLSPASVTKLLTSAALLHYYGPSFQFKTQVGYRGKFKNGVIHGDLVIKGDGDPSFVSETLWGACANLSHLGLKKVTGNIVIHNGIFSGQTRDAMRLEGASASANAYDAPVSAFGVNYNTLAIAVHPGSKVGKKAIVSLDPYTIKGVVIDNRLKTVSHRSRSKYRVERITMKDGRSKILLTGKVSLRDSLKKHYRSTYDPVLTSGEIFRAFLSKQGITVAGKVTQSNEAEFRTLVKIPSKNISDIIRDLNFYSNNFIADVMVKRLGAQDLSRPYAAIRTKGSYQSGMRAITDFLFKKVKLPTPLNLENGSGLTNNNRLTALQVSKVLLYMAKRWDLFPEFLASLPTSGETGTLEKRFVTKSTSALQGKIRAKTGTLTRPYSVSSIAGYAYHKDHGLIVFTIIQNGVRGKKQPGILDLQRNQEIGLLKLSKYL